MPITQGLFGPNTKVGSIQNVKIINSMVSDGNTHSGNVTVYESNVLGVINERFSTNGQFKDWGNNKYSFEPVEGASTVHAKIDGKSYEGGTIAVFGEKVYVDSKLVQEELVKPDQEKPKALNLNGLKVCNTLFSPSTIKVDASNTNFKVETKFGKSSS